LIPLEENPDFGQKYGESALEVLDGL